MASERMPGDGPPPILGRSELIATAFLLGGVAIIVGAIIVFAGGGGASDEATGVVTGTPTSPGATEAVSATGAPFSPVSADEFQIESLARKSIEVLPTGEWPTLYPDFTADFQARCTLADFTQAGVEGAEALGESLSLLAYKSMHSVTITGDTAVGTITGELRGQSEYNVQAAFAREGDVWKLAPAANTTGCSAFNRLDS